MRLGVRAVGEEQGGEHEIGGALVSFCAARWSGPEWACAQLKAGQNHWHTGHPFSFKAHARQLIEVPPYPDGMPDPFSLGDESYRTCPECGRDCEPDSNAGNDDLGVRIAFVCPVHGVHNVIDPFADLR